MASPSCRSALALQQGGGGATPQEVGWGIASGAATAVADGKMTDCQALAAFAGSVASLLPDPAQFVQAFGALTPQGWVTTHFPGVAWNAGPVYLNDGSKPSGYVPAYQNTITDPGTLSGDQGHHFAAFFQVGFLTGSSAATAVASLGFEYA